MFLFMFSPNWGFTQFEATLPAIISKANILGLRTCVYRLYTHTVRVYARMCVCVKSVEQCN